MGPKISLSTNKAISATSAIEGQNSPILTAQASAPEYQQNDAIDTAFGKMIFQGVKGDGYRYVAGHTKAYRLPPDLWNR